jgi:hypothetical protein
MFQQNSLTTMFVKKPKAAAHVRTFKKYQAANQKFEILIVGNSRVEMGLDPNSQYFNSQRVYNVGVPGLTLNAQITYAKNVIDTNPIHTIFIGLDFVNFVSPPPISNEPFELSNSRFEDYLGATLSLDALNASLSTIFNQTQYTSTRSNKGFNPANDYLPILRSEGQIVLNRQKLDFLSKEIKGARFYENEMIGSRNNSLSLLQNTLADWNTSGKKIIIFINPYQDLYYQTLDAEGLNQDFEIWRESIKEIANNTNSNFFDFTSLGKSHSNLLNDDGEQAYFWEPAHYKKELGEKMLKVMTSSVYE